MIEYVKTQHKCGHASYRGSSFGYPPQEAEQFAREAGYLVEEETEGLCKECGDCSSEAERRFVAADDGISKFPSPPKNVVE